MKNLSIDANIVPVLCRVIATDRTGGGTENIGHSTGYFMIADIPSEQARMVALLAESGYDATVEISPM